MDPFKKKDPQVEADTLREVVRDSLNKRKKPVKFTFEGLRNLGFLFETNPFNKLKQERIKELMEKRTCKLTSFI